MKRCFVLGGGGFIGARLIKTLSSRGLNYIAPQSRDLDLTSDNSVTQLQDLYQDGDHLIILAGLNPYRGDDLNLFYENLKIAENVQRSINEKIHHMIYVSSDAVYNQNVRYVYDDTPSAPNTLYGLMHHCRELIFNRNVDNLAIVRPTMVFGRNDPHNAYGPNRFLKSSREKNKIILFGNGEELRDYIEVNELANILIDISDSKFTSTFNLVGGKSFSFYQLAKLIISFRRTTKIISKPRKTEIFHREYVCPKIKKLFKTKINSINFHLEDLLRKENEGV